MDRREFLRLGVAAGAAALGVHTVPQFASAQDQTSQPCPHPPDDDRVREGVAGRSWVMAIDLAKCDG